MPRQNVLYIIHTHVYIYIHSSYLVGSLVTLYGMYTKYRALINLNQIKSARFHANPLFSFGSKSGAILTHVER